MSILNVKSFTPTPTGTTGREKYEHLFKEAYFIQAVIDGRIVDVLEIRLYGGRYPNKACMWIDAGIAKHFGGDGYDPEYGITNACAASNDKCVLARKLFDAIGFEIEGNMGRYNAGGVFKQVCEEVMCFLAANLNWTTYRVLCAHG